MKSRNLFEALTIAQSTHRYSPRSRLQVADATVLEALRHSVTDRDQIMQRRVRLLDDGRS